MLLVQKEINMGLLNKILDRTIFRKRFKAEQKLKWTKMQAQLDSELLPSRISFYKQLLSSGDLVFDVGANIGNRIEAFLACDAKVIAVEPQPSCSSQLEKKFGSRIIIEKIGLGEEEGELEMHLSTDSTVSTFNTDFIKATKQRFKYSKWNDKIKIPISTLDALIKKYGIPKFCKIDVEGFELQVLKGLQCPIPIISLEYCVPEMSEMNIKCIERLNDLSPSGLFNYSIEESMIWALPEWMNYENFLTHVKSKEFIDTLFGDIYFKTN
jgi:FkbM family methyltransferase